MAEEVRFMSFLRHKLLFGTQATQFPKASESFFLQAGLAIIRWMMSLG
jgi:hypothetical protein